MSQKLFWQIVALLVIAAALYVAAQIILLERAQSELQSQMERMSDRLDERNRD